MFTPPDVLLLLLFFCSDGFAVPWKLFIAAALLSLNVEYGASVIDGAA